MAEIEGFSEVPAGEVPPPATTDQDWGGVVCPICYERVMGGQLYSILEPPEGPMQGHTDCVMSQIPRDAILDLILSGRLPVVDIKKMVNHHL